MPWTTITTDASAIGFRPRRRRRHPPREDALKTHSGYFDLPVLDYDKRCFDYDKRCFARRGRLFDSPPLLVSGHTRGELERALERAFAEADGSGAGKLAPAAFRAALSRLDLGFAPRVVDAMCAHRGDAVDARDGRVSLRAFTRVAFDIAFAASASDVRAVSATRDATFFRAAVFATLRDAAAGSETITLTPRCRDALFGMGATMGVGLTRAHVAAAMRAAPPCALAGRVAWREFVPLAPTRLAPRRPARETKTRRRRRGGARAGHVDVS